jgi:hypothetical protein
MSKKICLITFFLAFLFLFPQKTFAEGIIINEVFVHPSSGNDEWIEIYNPDNTDLTSYFIDDDTNFADDIGTAKKQLTTISNGTYAVFTLSSSMFNNSGDFVVVYDQRGTIVDQYEFTNDPGVDVAIGRNPDATGTFQILESITKGSVNAGVQPTVTVTPTKIPTPTKTPTPTKIPTPTKAPTLTRSASPTKVPTIVPTKLVAVNTKSPQISLVENNATDSAYPTAVLGARISASPTKSPDKKVLVKESSNNATVIASSLIVGGIFILACAILIFFRIRKQES